MYTLNSPQTLNNRDIIHPCLTSFSIVNHSNMPSFILILAKMLSYITLTIPRSCSFTPYSLSTFNYFYSRSTKAQNTFFMA